MCAELMKRVETPVAIALGEAASEEVTGELLVVRPLQVNWKDQGRTVWIDPEGRPLRLRRDDGLTAVAERLVRYG